ncbi:MAG: glycosyltransferase family 4 protein, partial [Chloroflexota bacterium]|nr:glycosyltransferase family 4 protein [Chloroflexota bacterium]
MTSARLRDAPSAGPPAGRPVIGMLWGDFPWSAPPPKVGKLLSMGVTARNVTRALSMIGEVVPYVPPPDASPAGQRDALAAFLRAVDVLWADVYPASTPALRLRRDLGLPCPAILAAGGAMPKGAEAMLFPWRRLLRPGDGVLFTCQADRAIWRRLVRRSALREWTVPLGVDETVFHPRGPEERAAARDEHGLPPGAPLLLYVGRLNIQKGLHTLLRLFAAVRRAVPDAHLCLVGEEDDIGLWEFGVRNTGYVAWLRALAADLGIAGAVTFVAPRFGEDLARLYAAADVLVNAGFYHRENFGLAQAEAQACGVPVVCTAWGGFKDVVRPGETGYYMDAVLTKRGVRVDWATGARHVVTLLRDASLRAKMGARTAAWARERFGVA